MIGQHARAIRPGTTLTLGNPRDVPAAWVFAFNLNWAVFTIHASSAHGISEVGGSSSFSRVRPRRGSC
eukprot:9029420-Pyramimonas_sp.AAC.1